MKQDKYSQFLDTFIKFHYSKFNNYELRMYIFLFNVLKEKGHPEFRVNFSEFIDGWYDFSFSEKTPLVAPTGLDEYKAKLAMMLVDRKRLFTFELINPDDRQYKVRFNEKRFRRFYGIK